MFFLNFIFKQIDFYNIYKKNKNFTNLFAKKNIKIQFNLLVEMICNKKTTFIKIFTKTLESLIYLPKIIYYLILLKKLSKSFSILL